ncbi:hypothetical protein GCM10011450_24260 [Advenella faeciporci]|uniref:Uncharacterized protein n=1 Tax=Advenella faeciporci TaxID=797535 RepID=A0A918JNW6_9BURK|nr:GNAT family N-acetyltransferase [Advenella faeciporci]GGW93382.1 hypothetical protein GCM10011450_24260 [Advenella faeciporci]
MSKEKFKYEINRTNSKESVYRIGELFKKNSNEKDENHLLWQYLRPQHGSITSISVDENKNDTAVYSVFKIKAKINSSMGFAYQSLDTLTDQNHRGKGLFGILANDVYEQCNLSDHNIIYGFPNKSSGPVFFSRLGWKKLGYPPFVIYINNLLFPLVYLTKKNVFLENTLIKFYLKKTISKLSKKSNYLINSNEDFSEDYDNLWEKFSSEINTTIWRDSKYMNWRYKEKPNKKYKFLSIYKDNILIGKSIYTIEKKHNGNIGYVMDVICNPNHRSAAEVLLKQTVIEMINQKIDVILGWIPDNHFLFESYKKTKFIKLSRKLQPIKLFFGYKTNNKNIEIKNSDFFITYSDSDTV